MPAEDIQPYFASACGYGKQICAVVKKMLGTSDEKQPLIHPVFPRP